MSTGARTRPGGRTARTARAVFDATIAELAARPYPEISVETISARAGVHKTTVYRRWRTKAELVASAVADAADARIAVPDTGAIDSDLRALARAVQKTLASSDGAAVTIALVSAAPTSPEIARLLEHFWQARLGAIQVVVDRAIERSEVPERTDAAAVFQAMSAPLYYRLLVTAQPVRRADADLAAAAALLAARAGLFVPPRRAPRRRP